MNDQDEIDRVALEDAGLYNSIVYAAQLRDVALISSTFKIKPEYFEHRRETGEVGLNHAFNMVFTEPSYDTENELLLAQMEWNLTAKKGRENLVKLTAQYLIAYSHVPDMEMRHMSAFIGRVGKFATYPYFRAMVSQFSWASGAELPILPVLKQELGGLKPRK